MRVVIVGAGIAGLSAARALLDRGVRPTVIAPDHGNTAFGAGILSGQFADADQRRLARRSREIARGLVATNVCGHAQIATTRRGAATLDGLEDVEEELPPALASALAPAFRRRIVRAVFAREDLWLRVGDLLRELGRGARFLRRRVRSVGDGVVGTDAGTIETDRILLALGPRSPRLVPDLALATEPARTVRARIEVPSMFHVVETGFYARPDGAGGAVAGNGSLAGIRREAARAFGRPVACRGAGGGVIVFTHDRAPVLRRMSETTFVLTALGGDGLALGPALGERAAEWMLGRG